MLWNQFSLSDQEVGIWKLLLQILGLEWSRGIAKKLWKSTRQYVRYPANPFPMSQLSEICDICQRVLSAPLKEIQQERDVTLPCF